MKFDESRYVLGYESPDGRVSIYNLDGVAWHEAPIPRRFHRCWAQTRGWTGYFIQTFRCPCGAICYDPAKWGVHWDEKNIRKNPKTKGSVSLTTVVDVSQFARAMSQAVMSSNELRIKMGYVALASKNASVALRESSNIRRYEAQLRLERNRGLSYVRHLGDQAVKDLQLKSEYAPKNRVDVRF